MSSMQQTPFMDEALLEEAQIRPAPEGNREEGPSWLTAIGFLFLTFNSGMAVYRSNRAEGANRAMELTPFMGFSFLDLALIAYCLCLYNRTPPGSPQREHLRMAMWLLATMLTHSAFMLLEIWLPGTGGTGAKIYG